MSLGRTSLALLSDFASPERITLRSSSVGWVRLVVEPGDWVAAGQRVGSLEQLGARWHLQVADDLAGGRVAKVRPQRVPHATDFGEALFDLVLITDVEPSATVPATADEPTDESAICAPQSGRFYRRPAPGEPEFLGPGEPLGAGTMVGLLEVMKTFAPVRYENTSDDSVLFDRYLVADGAEVTKGTPVVALRETAAQ